MKNALSNGEKFCTINMFVSALPEQKTFIRGNAVMKLLQPSRFSSLSEADCINIQQKLSSEVIQQNSVSIESIRTIAGVDLAYWKEQRTERAVCCIVVLDFLKKAVIETQYSAGTVDFPYLPGCLAFRELPLVVDTAAKLTQKPDVFLFDGNGILHARGMGLATHASFYLQAPTIGIAKHYYQVDGAAFAEPDNFAGSYSDIVKDGKILGRAIRTHQAVKPVFASVGNYIDIETVTTLTLMLTGSESHIPIPTRYADLETHIKRRELRAPEQDA